MNRGLALLLLAPFTLLLACDPPPPGFDAGRITQDSGPPVQTDAGSDAGRTDAGPLTDAGTDGGPPTDCGNPDQTCCAGNACNGEGECEGGACCIPSGAQGCGGPDECCTTGNQCVGNTCCAPVDGTCRNSGDCCDDLLCADGVCLAPFEECGRLDETCCTGDQCRSGLTCRGGTCSTCGGLHDLCCAAPNECTGGNRCVSGRCLAPDPTCGADGQPCCAAGDECQGTLTCEGDVCGVPDIPCDYADCGDCTQHAGCGFCGDGAGACQEGTSTGPSAGSCTAWAWTDDECVGDPCASATNCGDCTDRNSCGWCAGTNTCVPGSSSGPGAGGCGDWDWWPEQCGGVDCAANTDCGSCLDTFPCGWCETSNTCIEGSSSGPQGSVCADWDWFLSECTMPDPCNTHTACGECTGDLDCGWCESTGDCRTGEASGPDDGSCLDWDYVPSSCQCSPIQGACSTDNECCGGGTTVSCRAGFSFPERCCAEAGTSCAAGGDCCGRMDCGGTPGAETCQCRTNTRACIEDGDCCSNNCAAGTCQP